MTVFDLARILPKFKNVNARSENLPSAITLVVRRELATQKVSLWHSRHAAVLTRLSQESEVNIYMPPDHGDPFAGGEDCKGR